ncbi:hypothetical protein TNCV_4635911 [Trichonephila clavipes]|nr:hypothetical protein TNCV_4635911 [Trichonephila clavipes]
MDAVGVAKSAIDKEHGMLDFSQDKACHSSKARRCVPETVHVVPQAAVVDDLFRLMEGHARLYTALFVENRIKTETMQRREHLSSS